MKYAVRYDHFVKLFQITALEDGKYARKGDIGGWIETMSNLSQRGECWISKDACAVGDSRVLKNAFITGTAMVADCATVTGNAILTGNSAALDEAFVTGNAIVCGESSIQDEAVISGRSIIYGDTIICYNEIVNADVIIKESDITPITKEPYTTWED